MEKIKMALLAIATLTLLATIAGCSSTKVASAKASDTSSSGVFVSGATIKGAIEGSEVFIEGRTVNIPSLWFCDHEVTRKNTRLLWETIRVISLPALQEERYRQNVLWNV